LKLIVVNLADGKTLETKFFWPGCRDYNTTMYVDGRITYDRFRNAIILIF